MVVQCGERAEARSLEVAVEHGHIRRPRKNGGRPSRQHERVTVWEQQDAIVGCNLECLPRGQIL